MEDGIRDATTDLAKALSSGDAAAAAAFYLADGRLLSPAADVVAGRSQIEAYWRAGIACGLSGVDLSTIELHVGGETAVEIGRYQLELDGVADRGKYVALHRRRADGTWGRAVDVFNPDVPQGRVPTLKEDS